jgi:hypothetical protein
MKGKKSGKVERPDDGNVWKIVSVVFIALFIVILLWAIIGIRQTPHFDEPTLEQADVARSVVAQDLLASGDSIDNYDVSVTNRMLGFVGRHHPRNGVSIMEPESFLDMQNCLGRNLQVSLRGNSTGYVYTVDVDEQKILMKSFTEWFDD